MKKRPKDMPSYVTDELYNKYSDIFDAALAADKKWPNKHLNKINLIIGTKGLDSLKKALTGFKSDK